MDGGERLVHVEEVAGEQVGLFSALGPTDFNDHVAAVVRVGRQQQGPEFLLEACYLSFEGNHLGPEHLPVIAL